MWLYSKSVDGLAAGAGVEIGDVDVSAGVLLKSMRDLGWASKGGVEWLNPKVVDLEVDGLGV